MSSPEQRSTGQRGCQSRVKGPERDAVEVATVVFPGKLAVDHCRNRRCLSARKPGEKEVSAVHRWSSRITFHAEKLRITKVSGSRGEEGVVARHRCRTRRVATSNITVDGEELVVRAGEVQEDFVGVVSGHCGFNGEGCTAKSANALLETMSAAA